MVEAFLLYGYEHLALWRLHSMCVWALHVQYLNAIQQFMKLSASLLLLLMLEMNFFFSCFLLKLSTNVSFLLLSGFGKIFLKDRATNFSPFFLWVKHKACYAYTMPDHPWVSLEAHFATLNLRMEGGGSGRKNRNRVLGYAADPVPPYHFLAQAKCGCRPIHTYLGVDPMDYSGIYFWVLLYRPQNSSKKG